MYAMEKKRKRYTQDRNFGPDCDMLALKYLGIYLILQFNSSVIYKHHK